MRIRIHLVTSLTGFPNGTAAANRIKMIGKALIESGCILRVYTNSISVDIVNNDAQGTFDNIGYLNLHGTTELQRNKLVRSFIFLKGLVKLFSVIRSMESGTDLVYLYAHPNGIFFNFSTLFFCMIFRIKVVQEINEWFHNDQKRIIQKFFAEGMMLRSSAGAVVISDNINSLVKKIRPELKTIIIPVLGEPFSGKRKTNQESAEKYCFWMGLVDGYLEDILFIVKACGLCYRRGNRFSLVISGTYNNLSRIKIFNEAEASGFPRENIRLLGYVSDSQIEDLCLNASFFVVPLWETERSSSRFPTKIAYFMFSGNPLITCNIGATGKMLVNGKDVLFYKPGEITDLSQKINTLLENKGLYDELALNTFKYASEKFLYKNYSQPLNEFFLQVLENQQR